MQLSSPTKTRLIHKLSTSTHVVVIVPDVVAVLTTGNNRIDFANIDAATLLATP
jgi:hypothetical protein